jgi:hypothetical protein
MGPAGNDNPASLILESDNAKNLSADELRLLAGELADLLRNAGQEHLTVNSVAHEPKGAGNNFADVLFVFLPTADFVKDQVWGLVLPRVVSFMRKRFSRKHEATRPRVVILYGPDGQPLREIELKSADSEPVWREPDGAPRLVPAAAGRG